MVDSTGAVCDPHTSAYAIRIHRMLQSIHGGKSKPLQGLGTYADSIHSPNNHQAPQGA